MKVTILTSFPDFYTSIVSCSLLKRAMDKGLWSLRLVDIRSFGVGPRKKIDDYSYGGGGMVMRPDVVSDCIQASIPNPLEIPSSPGRLFVTMSPRGRVLSQKQAEFISRNITELYVLCSRFEGVDQRVIDHYSIEELSIGDYVLLGGESASVVLIESVIRLLPNVMNNELTTQEESFSDALDGMLEYDQFTRPEEWNGLKTPDILTSGNHAKIKEWRLDNAKHRTRLREMLNKD